MHIVALRPKQSILVLLGLAALLSVLLSAPQAGAFGNGQAAALVLGQSSFTTNTSGAGPDHFAVPAAIAVDPVTGAVFVVDYDNNRVLRFAPRQNLLNGSPAVGVLGQPNFTSTVSATSAQGMNKPSGVVVDSSGRLWVADTNNRRVLWFNAAAGKPNGAAADGVLGQPNFTSNTAATSVQGMHNPQGVAVDSSGRLWVADNQNHRVLRFDSAASKANGAAANGVLGQPNFTSASPATTAQGMYNPRAVAVDGGGRLWVADSQNHRVLRFNAAASIPNGGGASGVLGQSNFTSNTSVTTAQRMSFPVGVAVDGNGRLWVADNENHRVLRFDAAASNVNGAAADGVLGQPDFTSNTVATSAQGMYAPRGVAVDGSGRLWVADRDNNRVLLFEEPAPPTITPSPSVTTTPSSTPTNTPVPTPTSTPTNTPVPTPSSMPTALPVPTPTSTPPVTGSKQIYLPLILR